MHGGTLVFAVPCYVDNRFEMRPKPRWGTRFAIINGYRASAETLQLLNVRRPPQSLQMVEQRPEPLLESEVKEPSGTEVNSERSSTPENHLQLGPQPPEPSPHLGVPKHRDHGTEPQVGSHGNTMRRPRQLLQPRRGLGRGQNRLPPVLHLIIGARANSRRSTI